jgi:hypothetical protein
MMTEEEKEGHLRKIRYSQWLYEKYGERVLRDLEEYEDSRMEEIWKNIGEEGERTLEKLIELCWGPASADIVWSIVRKEPTEIEIHCTKCPIAEMAREYGMKEVIESTYCIQDYGLVRGFNPRITFSRTKTLIMGDEYCNHTYTLIDD